MIGQNTPILLIRLSMMHKLGMTGSDVRFELWNEPDLSAFWGSSQSRWLEAYRRAYQQIKAAIPNAVIEGPSLSAYPNSSNSWWTNFLDYANANNCLPDIFSWHDEWGGNDSPVASKTINSTISTLTLE